MAGIGAEIQHGHAKRGMHTPEYRAWRNMLTRCYNPNYHEYHRYGGRGIRVCRKWRFSFAAFLADVGERPTDDHQIDRIDNDANYDPGNVRWTTRRKQLRNRSNSLKFRYKGKCRSLVSWSKKLGISYGTLYDRIFRQKLSFKQAISKGVVR